jgi:RNA polymerase sigma-70 factor (ECF subfamily)
MADKAEITKLLRVGDEESLAKLLPLVYDELRSLAAALFSRERANHTLQPTALVHEAYLRLTTGSDKLSWQNRAHFFGIAANSMRQILVNHAKARRREKRGGGQTLIALDGSISFSYARNLDVLALNEALETLAQLDARQVRIVELRFFGGLTLEETATMLDVSTATVSREWEMARTWLYRQLSGSL